MRRLYTWLAGVVGGAAAYRAFRRHSGPVHGPIRDRAQEPDARADELRAKLAQARDAGDDRESFEAGEVPVDQVDVPPAEDLETRRRSVHDKARAAIDEMQGD
jgi:hypothetical protein